MNERPNAICVDTGVLTASLRAGSALEARYRRHLTGRRLVIASQVVAEARFGALRAGWGDRRIEELAAARIGHRSGKIKHRLFLKIKM